MEAIMMGYVVPVLICVALILLLLSIIGKVVGDFMGWEMDDDEL